MTTPGRCRFCECTEDNACILPNGDPCCWANAARDVCSNPSCLARLYAKRQEQNRQKPRPRRRTPGEVHAIILAEKAAKRRRWRDAAKARRKGRAA